MCGSSPVERARTFVVKILTVGNPNLPDITIRDFTHVLPGATTVIYTVTVQNPSTTDIMTSFEVHIYYDRATAPTPALVGDDSQVVNTLPAGSQLDRKSVV